MRPLQFLTLSLILLLPLRVGAKEGCDQRKPAEMGPGYFALPLHHAVSLPLQDLPDQSAIEEAPVRIRPLHRITISHPPSSPQPDPALQGADSGGIEQQSTGSPSTENPVRQAPHLSGRSGEHSSRSEGKQGEAISLAQDT